MAQRQRRTIDPDPQAVQDALDTVLRMSVVQLGRIPMYTDRPPFLDLVVFKAPGKEYCASQLPPERASECSEQQGLTWSKREVLGFAVVTFDDPKKPTVLQYRFRGETSLVPQSREVAGHFDADTAQVANLTHIALEELVAIDVDGDHAEEYIARVSHTTLSGGFEEGPGAVYELFTHRRLLIIRADLSLEADGYVSQYWDSGSPGWSLDNDRLNEKYTFEGGDLVLEWCEFFPHVEECPLEVLCATPTERLVIAYDPRTDNYPIAQREQLRPAVADVDWEGGECVPPSTAPEASSE